MLPLVIFPTCSQCSGSGLGVFFIYPQSCSYAGHSHVTGSVGVRPDARLQTSIKHSSIHLVQYNIYYFIHFIVYFLRLFLLRLNLLHKDHGGSWKSQRILTGRRADCGQVPRHLIWSQYSYKAYIDTYRTYYFVVCTPCTVEELPIEYQYRVSVRN